MRESYARRVARGARWLDEVKPGWIALIDRDTLFLRDVRRCVLGQVFREEAQAGVDVEAGEHARPGFAYKLDEIGLSMATALGFTIMSYWPVRLRNWDRLHDAWDAELDRRSRRG